MYILALGLLCLGIFIVGFNAVVVYRNVILCRQGPSGVPLVGGLLLSTVGIIFYQKTGWFGIVAGPLIDPGGLLTMAWGIILNLKFRKENAVKDGDHQIKDQD